MMMNRKARAVRKPRSSATLWEQLLEYFEVRLRTEKYAVTYFFGVSGAKRSGPRKKAGGARARNAVEDINGRCLAEPARDKEGGPFMPQTVLLRLEADRGFGTISDTVGVETFLRSGFR